MLENQFKHLQKSGYKMDLNEATTQTGGSLDPNSDGYSGDGFFHKIAIPMVRRTFPNLIAQEIVGVQPMTGPVGLAFAMRFVADQEYDGAAGTELGFNSVDKDYTGPVNTETGEALGSVAGTNEDQQGLGIGTGSQIKEVSMTLEKAQVEAKTRKLRSRWSLEVAQDIENMHGLNLEDEMADILSYEITAEIDRELIGEIRTLADDNLTVIDYEDDLDGRWEAERFRGMYNAIVRKANKIAINTRRGPGNWIVGDPNICAGLETLPAFSVQPVQGDINTAQFGVAKTGTLDTRFTLYRDTFHDNDEALVGYKGPASEYDTGVIYLPYIQLMLSKTVDYASFQPSLGLLSRYSIMSNLFGASNFYQKLRFTNMHTYST